METSTEKNLPIYQLQTPSDLAWQAKIVNAINSIRLKNKKRFTSQRIFSFINKGALQLDCQKFNDILCDMEIDGKIYNGSGKNASFFVDKYLPLEAVSPVKNLDLTVDNTHSHSSLSFASSKSVATPDTSQNPKDAIDSDLGGIHSATPIIHCVKTPLLQTEGTSYGERKFYFSGGSLKINKKRSTNYSIFYVTVTMKSQNNFFFTTTLMKKNYQKML